MTAIGGPELKESGLDAKRGKFVSRRRLLRSFSLGGGGKCRASNASRIEAMYVHTCRCS